MCLTILKNQKVLRVLNRPKIVYKILRKDTDYEDIAHSVYETFTYKLSYYYNTEILRKSYGCTYDDLERSAINKYFKTKESHIKIKHLDLEFISHGFHSALNVERLLQHKDIFSIYGCRMPIGTKYMIGFTDLVVSNEIQICKEIKL